jgi:penicillin-binding protein 1A
MEALLVKIFATALALSQVTTAPEAVATRFDRVSDQPVLAQLLRAGCTNMRKTSYAAKSCFDQWRPAPPPG